MTPKLFLVCALAALSFSFSGCANNTIPPAALQLQKDTLADRQLQTRRFETEDEKALLVAGSGVLQDLGFNLDESETQLGVLVGSKKRDATDAGQMAGAIAMAVLFGSDMAVDKDQLIRASLVTKQSKNGGYLLRITFQRVVWNNKGVISKIQAIKDNDIYVQFFDKLSKAVFLDAQEI